VPRLILGAAGQAAAPARAGGPPTLNAPVTISPSRLLGSVRHLLGMPGMPIRTRTFENVFERKTPRELSILLVEDNSVNVLVAVGFLKRLGCAVDVAENGLVAIPRVCDGNYDLVLMDVHMPEVDGLEATRRIRKLAGDRMVRIIGISAATSPDEIQECLDAGMDGFLSKPLQPKALREALDAVARDIASQGKTAA
jgi:CheY-like chemotaxis protein